MKTVVKFALKHPVKILVTEDQNVEKGDNLAVNESTNKDIIIDIASTLKISPGKIFKYLKKNPTDNVLPGDLLAEKKSFIKTITVKSPVKGKIKEVELGKGTILISENMNDTATKFIKSPVLGKVKKIGKDTIELEVKGHKLEGKSGTGKDRFGELYQLHSEHNTFFDFGSDVENKIVLLAQAEQEVIAKLDALDALGVICKKNNTQGKFSVLTVSDESYKELSSYSGSFVWLRPIDHEVVLLSE